MSKSEGLGAVYVLIGGPFVAVICVLFLILLPTVNHAGAPRRNPSTTNNLKLIALAMLQFESKAHSLPARAIFDEHGMPLLRAERKITSAFGVLGLCCWRG